MGVAGVVRSSTEGRNSATLDDYEFNLWSAGKKFDPLIVGFFCNFEIRGITQSLRPKDPFGI
jgi:hypothetical protein